MGHEGKPNTRESEIEARLRAIYERFREAEKERRRLLHDAMRGAYEDGSEVLSPGELLGLSLTGSLEETEKLTTLEKQIARHIDEPILAVSLSLRRAAAGIIREAPVVRMLDKTRGDLDVDVCQAYMWHGGEWQPSFDRRADEIATITLAQVSGETGRHYEYEYWHGRQPVPILYQAKYPYEEEGSILLIGHEQILADSASQQHHAVLTELYKSLRQDQTD